MKRILFFILIPIILLFPLAEGQALCSIDGKLSPKLAKYESDMRTLMSKLKENTQNRCGPTTGGSVATLNRTAELFDRAMLQVPVYGDILIDFQYNTVMALRGESRSAVQKNGEIFQKILTRVINPTIDTLASTCNLTDEKGSTLINAIKLNYLLESTYKSVAVWTPRSDEGIPDAYKEVYTEIINTYNPKATESCKNEFNYEEDISKAIETFSKGTFGIENAYDDWHEAIALFSGKSTRWKYEDIARRLLKKELARQGMSKAASDIIVSNFDCVRARENEGSSLEDEAKAIAECKKMPIIGLDKLKSEFDKATKESPNTEVYVTRLLKSQELLSDAVDVNALHSRFIWEASNQIKINEKITADLVNLHIDLLSVNKLLEKRIPVMQKNCMKSNPDIVGGCRKWG